jgi:hypothetical protein
MTGGGKFFVNQVTSSSVIIDSQGQPGYFCRKTDTNCLLILMQDPDPDAIFSRVKCRAYLRKSRV